MATITYRDPATGDFLPLEMGGMPVGSVIAFAGTAAPAGWHLCDGTAHGSAALETILGSPNTPDLQDRFVAAIGTTISGTGGAATVTLTAAQSGNSGHIHTGSSGNNNVGHTHQMTGNTVAAHNHGARYRGNIRTNTQLNTSNAETTILRTTSTATSNEPIANHTHPAFTSAAANVGHSHALTVAAGTAVAATEAHENMPPYFALAFIICTG